MIPLDPRVLAAFPWLPARALPAQWFVGPDGTALEVLPCGGVREAPPRRWLTWSASSYPLRGTR